MAKLTYVDGTTEYVDYNEAAKIWQILHGNSKAVDPKDLKELTDKATRIIDINFKALEP